MPAATWLDIGLDVGFSKTTVAILDARGAVLGEARIDHFEHPAGRSIEARARRRRVLRSVTQILAPFRAQPMRVFGGKVGSSAGFLRALRRAGLDVRRLEVFNDTHNHYGLTAMPGNAITVACGSYWNAMYYDAHNNVECFASSGPIWDAVPWHLSGIAFARFLLDTWVAERRHGEDSALSRDVARCAGIADQAGNAAPATLAARMLEDPRRWLRLGALLPAHLDRPDVAAFARAGLAKAAALYARVTAQVRPREPPLLVVGGSIWTNDRLFAWLRGVLDAHGACVVRVRGNAAVGAVRFRTRNPTARLEPWAIRREGCPSNSCAGGRPNPPTPFPRREGGAWPPRRRFGHRPALPPAISRLPSPSRGGAGGEVRHSHARI